jgi:hypothetical protein
MRGLVCMVVEVVVLVRGMVGVRDGVEGKGLEG